jgi:hypothetical protein
MARPKFSAGHVVATQAAMRAMLARNNPLEFLGLHMAGDWGDLGEHDKRQNDMALKDGGRLLSCYTLPNGQKVWVITDAAPDEDYPLVRDVTTFLLPEEY